MIPRELVQERLNLQTKLRAAIDKANDMPEKQIAFEEYLKIFPRHHKVWIEYCQQNPSVYERAISACRKSPLVWRQYFAHLGRPISEELLADASEALNIDDPLNILEDPLLPADLSPFRIHPYWASIPSSEDVFQKIIFYHNDDPAAWIQYSDWLQKEGRSEDALELLERACFEFAPFLPQLKIEAAKLCASDPERARILYHAALDFSSLELLNVEVVFQVVEFGNAQGEFARSKEILHAALLKESKLVEKSFLQLLLWQTLTAENPDSQEAESLLSELVQSADGLIFGYALLQSRSIDPENDPVLQRKLGANYHVFVKILDTVPSKLIPRDGAGRPPPPRPIEKPKAIPGETVSHQIRQPKRALPGYTPGWMAAEYAKKHFKF